MYSMDELHSSRTSGWLDWVFNGTSAQKCRFVPTAGEGNCLMRLRIANEIKCSKVHDNNVTQFTVKHSSYTSATTGYLIV